MTLRTSEQFIENVKMVMEIKGISQQRLTDLLTLFTGKLWHRRSVNRMLNNQRRVDVDELSVIAVILECGVEDLLSTGFFLHTEYVSGTANQDRR